MQDSAGVTPQSRSIFRKLWTLVFLLIWSATAWSFTPSGLLEIHYINVGQGGSALIIGPDGTTVLLEAGWDGKGTSDVVPYLESIGLMPSDGLDYMIAGHQHSDHLGGLDEVIQAGYDVRTAVYYNGSTYSTSSVTGFFDAALTTTAGPAVPMPLGTVIPLGNGAHITCVAVNGQLIDGTVLPVTDENDRSIALLVQDGNFDYLWASDLGGGMDDNACTGRSTTQINVETALIQAISPGGGVPLLRGEGVDVLHVNHHGSESSTNSDYMDLARPEVAIISTGAGQDPTWQHPRIDVVDHVLLAEASCVTVPPVLVLQTEEGNPTGPQTSFSGYSVGDIVVTTDGVADYSIRATGRVSQGPDERAAAGLPITLPLDEVAPPPPTPTPATGPSPTPTPRPPSPTPTPTQSLGGLSAVVINEYLPAPQTDWNGSGSYSSPDDEWIELYNKSSLPVDLGGAKLDDIPNGGSSPYTIPAGTLIPAGGVLVFYGSTTRISLNNTGDTVQLLAPDGVTVIDSRIYGSTVYDRSEGRWPDGSSTWAYFTGPAPGGTSGAPSPGSLNGGPATPTPTPTWTSPPAPTSTPTWTPTPTMTSPPAPTSTPTETPPPTSTPTWTPTPTETSPPAPTSTPTETSPPAPTSTPTETSPPAPTSTPTETSPPTSTPTWTPIPTETWTPTPTETWTPTWTPTATPTKKRGHH
jgi:beta-lactamase superfamily II metal-dependent hydrolase